ncbi:MAG: class I SAM-dependent methyltransferase [Candidatus Hermodarchaeota archaeon]
MIFEKLAQRIRRDLRKIPLLQNSFYFLYKLFFKPSHVRRLKKGFCPLCGKNSFMLIDSKFVRETGICLICSANTRYRFMAEILKRLIIIKYFNNKLDKERLYDLVKKIELWQYPLRKVLKVIKSKNIWIYEPSALGAMHNVLKKHPKFVYSEYWPYPNLISGKMYGGIQFEDLQSLSFEDDKFDLVITQDILEHVRDLSLTLKEIYRILKPYGIHVFTVPIGKNEKTIHRIDKNDNVLIEPINYHTDHLAPEGSKVYRDFGTDITEILKNHKFESFILIQNKDFKKGIYSKVHIIISVKK